jgi:predicted TIM-barrel fold metal-dependent hydrolase
MAEGFQDELKVVLYTYPTVYVDIGGLMWMRPVEDFERMVRDLVDAGYAGRLMFGSDQMNWPGLISRSIEIVRNADYLAEEQKEGILFSNAARFLKMDEASLSSRALGE